MLLIIFTVLVFSFSLVLRKWLLFWTSAEFLNTFFYFSGKNTKEKYILGSFCAAAKV